MSHYLVAVIHKPSEDVDKMLRRFYEGLEVLYDAEDDCWYNPDAKWDWYEVGGRWDGFIKTKSGDSVNEAKIKDIEFGVDEKEFTEYKRWWEVVVEDAPLRAGETESEFVSWYKNEYLIDRYGNADNFAKEQASFNTYAVLTPDCLWHEPGQMGWFGVSLASVEEERNWYDVFTDIIESSDPEDIMTIVDCHI